MCAPPIPYFPLAPPTRPPTVTRSGGGVQVRNVPTEFASIIPDYQMGKEVAAPRP